MKLKHILEYQLNVQYNVYSTLVFKSSRICLFLLVFFMDMHCIMWFASCNTHPPDGVNMKDSSSLELFLIQFAAVLGTMQMVVLWASPPVSLFVPTLPAFLHLWRLPIGLTITLTPLNSLLGTLKLQSNGPLYSSTVIGTLVVDVLHLVQRGGLGVLGSHPVPSSLYQM